MTAMKIETKQQLLDFIEETRKAKGISIKKACENTGNFTQAMWSRFKLGQREPSWDKLYQMAKAVGIRIHVSARLG